MAAAAYRAGQKLYDARAKKYHDYHHRNDVAHAEILAPDQVPAFLKNREVLWNEIEKAENRKDAQLARSIILGLPYELDHQEQLSLLRGFVLESFVKEGMIADIAIHKPDLEKAADWRNYHAHILLTLRQADSNGLYRTKTRSWNSKDLTVKWRAAWASAQNRAFERKGLVMEINQRTLKPSQKKEFAKEHFPKPYQFTLEPEKKLGPIGSIGYQRALAQNREIVARNLSILSRKRQRYQKRQRQLDKLKARRLKTLAPYIEQAHKVSDPFKKIKFLAAERKRMKALIEKIDMVFQFLILLWGYEQAVKRRAAQLNRLAKNLHDIDHTSEEIEQTTTTSQANRKQRELSARLDPDRPNLPPAKKQKLTVKNSKLETTKLRRRRRRNKPT